jgi:hypothetical protein
MTYHIFVKKIQSPETYVMRNLFPLRWNQKAIHDFGENITGGKKEYFLLFDRIEQLPGDYNEIFTCGEYS